MGYNSLLGHGMQCALPEQVFEILREFLDASFECFASPLNSRYPRFCSAFSDTDGAFGSIGCFFEVTGQGGALRKVMLEKGGSYEVNPPFIERIMAASVTRAESILYEGSAAPL